MTRSCQLLRNQQLSSPSLWRGDGDRLGTRPRCRVFLMAFCGFGGPYLWSANGTGGGSAREKHRDRSLWFSARSYVRYNAVTPFSGCNQCRVWVPHLASLKDIKQHAPVFHGGSDHALLHGSLPSPNSPRCGHLGCALANLLTVDKRATTHDLVMQKSTPGHEESGYEERCIELNMGL